MRKVSRYMKINIVILITLIILPTIVLASVPKPSSYDRHNIYEKDGYRAGGYYVIRDNPSINGSMNISFDGGTTFNITTINIENITLDFDLMFEKRSFLFGWIEYSWADVVHSLGDAIYINIETDGSLNSINFVDYPNIIVRVWKNDTIYRPWNSLKDGEVYTEGFDEGIHTIKIEFIQDLTIYDLMNFLMYIVVIIGVLYLLYRLIRQTLFGDDGDYYRRYW